MLKRVQKKGNDASGGYFAALNIVQQLLDAEQRAVKTNRRLLNALYNL